MALNPLFEKVSDDTIKFESKDPVQVGIADVEYCIKSGLVQQGITALDETIKVLLCVKFNLDYTEYYNRKLVKDLLMVEKYSNYEIRNETERDQINKLMLGMGKNKIPKDFINLTYNLGKLRNDINHFGLSEKAKESDKIKEELKNHFDEFKRVEKLISSKK